MVFLCGAGWCTPWQGSTVPFASVRVWTGENDALADALYLAPGTQGVVAVVGPTAVTSPLYAVGTSGGYFASHTPLQAPYGGPLAQGLVVTLPSTVESVSLCEVEVYAVRVLPKPPFYSLTVAGGAMWSFTKSCPVNTLSDTVSVRDFICVAGRMCSATYPQCYDSILPARYPLLVP